MPTSTAAATAAAAASPVTRGRAPSATPDKAGTLDRLENEVGILARRIRRVMNERARATHPDLTTPGYLILQKLRASGPLRSSDLVNEFGIDKGAISRQVQQLVDLDLVERTADPEDGRAQLIAVSAFGVQRMTGTAVERRHLLEHRLSGWDDAELDAFVTALERYNASLEHPAGD